MKDKRSSEAQAYRHLYKSSRWIKARARFIFNNPLCKFCMEYDARAVAADIVDHIKPHKGDLQLFWDETNWQSLCKPCHDGRKQRSEKNSHLPEIGLDGWPIEQKKEP